MSFEYLSLDEAVEYLNLTRKNQVEYKTERLCEEVLGGRLPVLGRYFPRGAKWRIGDLIARTDSEAQANSARETSAKPIDYLGCSSLRRRRVEREAQFLTYPRTRLNYSDEQIERFIETELLLSTTHDNQPNPTMSRAEAARRVNASIERGVESFDYKALEEPIQLCVAGAVYDYIEAIARGQEAHPMDVVVAELANGMGGVLHNGKRPFYGWPDGACLVFRRADLDVVGKEKSSERSKNSGASKGGKSRAATWEGAREACRAEAKSFRAGKARGERPTLDDCAAIIFGDREAFEARYNVTLPSRESTVRAYLKTPKGQTEV